MKRPLLLAAALLAVSTPAAASPLLPWGAPVGEGVFALTPFLFVDQSPGFYPYLYLQYGFSDRFEILGGGGVGIYPGASEVFAPDEFEILPRYFVHETTAVVLHALYVGGDTDVAVGPEVHGVYELGPITLTANGGWQPRFGGSGFGAGSAFLQLAPEWYFTDASSLFVELNPEIDLSAGDAAFGDRFYMEVIPGVSTAIADTHFLAFGVAIPVTGFDPTGIYGGMWYSIAFGGE